MSKPEPSIRVNVDVTNPGQFFACRGLLELADRLWPGAEGWFESCARIRGGSGMIFSSQHNSVEAGKLPKARIERHDLQTGGGRKRRQVRVVPEVRRKSADLGQCPPRAFQVRRFCREADSRVENGLIVDGPGLAQRLRLLAGDWLWGSSPSAEIPFACIGKNNTDFPRASRRTRSAPRCVFGAG